MKGKQNTIGNAKCQDYRTKKHAVKEVSRRKTDPDFAYVPFLISIEANCSFHNTPNDTFIACGRIKR
jgi:hypothetical protein